MCLSCEISGKQIQKPDTLIVTDLVTRVKLSCCVKQIDLSLFWQI
jgi:hypothetical protein